MGRQRHGAEQIIAKLREAEVELARGKRVPGVARHPTTPELIVTASEDGRLSPLA